MQIRSFMHHLKSEEYIYIYIFVTPQVKNPTKNLPQINTSPLPIFTYYWIIRSFHDFFLHTRGSDKSLARPGRKQARKHDRDARDFNNIETRDIINFFPPARQGAEGNSRHSDRNISLFPSWSGEGLISPPAVCRRGVQLAEILEEQCRKIE